MQPTNYDYGAQRFGSEKTPVRPCISRKSLERIPVDDEGRRSAVATKQSAFNHGERLALISA
jgi:hypothetical protein